MFLEGAVQTRFVFLFFFFFFSGACLALFVDRCFCGFSGFWGGGGGFRVFRPFGSWVLQVFLRFSVHRKPFNPRPGSRLRLQSLELGELESFKPESQPHALETSRFRAYNPKP